MPSRPCRRAFQFVVTGDRQIPAHTLCWRTRLSHIVSYRRYGMSVNLSTRRDPAMKNGSAWPEERIVGDFGEYHTKWRSG